MSSSEASCPYHGHPSLLASEVSSEMSKMLTCYLDIIHLGRRGRHLSGKEGHQAHSALLVRFPGEVSSSGHPGTGYNGAGAAKRSYPTLEVRGGGQEELRHIQGVAAVQLQEGGEELLHVQGQEGWP